MSRDIVYTVDIDICRKFQANPSINPFTGRSINVNAKNGVYHFIKNACENLNYPISPTNTLVEAQIVNPTSCGRLEMLSSDSSSSSSEESAKGILEIEFSETDSSSYVPSSSSTTTEEISESTEEETAQIFTLPPPPVSSPDKISSSGETSSSEVVVVPPLYTPPSVVPPLYTPPSVVPPLYTPPSVVPPLYTPPSVVPPLYTPPPVEVAIEAEDMISLEDCMKLIENPTINPLTGRRIKKGGKTWLELKRLCAQRNIDISQTKKRYCYRWLSNKLRDPMTGSLIDITSDRYAQYLRDCEMYRDEVLKLERDNLLAIIEDACHNKTDPVTGELFTDMSTEDLNSVVCIGCETGNGTCYSLDTIYRHYELAVFGNAPVSDIMNPDQLLTAAEIEDIHRKMRARYPLYEAPTFQIRKPLGFELVVDKEENFYHISIVETIDNENHLRFDLGYIPSNLNISSVAIDLLFQIWRMGRLLTFGNGVKLQCCTVPLMKSKNYWTMDTPDNTRRLLEDMIVEFRAQLS